MVHSCSRGGGINARAARNLVIATPGGDRVAARTGFDLYEEDGETVGQQYSTSIGRIDLLARSKDQKQWLVIELKKGRTSDDVVGQTLRYIGWIRRNEAALSEEVKGIIIAGQRDERLEYALETLKDISLDDIRGEL